MGLPAPYTGVMTDDAIERVTPPKTERPRDEFGRPMPRGSEARLVLPDFDLLTIEECHRRGIEYFDAAIYFGAHEAWETAWRMARKAEHPDEEFFKGLSQLGAGYTHYQRGNPRGAHTLMDRGVGRIRAYGARHRDIDVEALANATEANMARLVGLTRGDPLPTIETTRIGA